MLRPPDFSREHAPIGALFLANPTARLTPEGVRVTLNMFGFTINRMASVSSTLVGHARSGMMSKNERGEYGLVVPPADFLSEKERNRRNSVSKRDRWRAKGLTSQGTPWVGQRKARQYDTPTARTAGEDRAFAVNAARNLNAGRVADRIEAHILANPGETFSENDFKAFATTTILRKALSLLSENNRVRFWVTGTARITARTVYAALPVPSTTLKLTERHNQVLEALKRRKVMSMADVRHVLHLDSMADAQQARAESESIALDLYHLSLAHLKPVGATYVLKAA